MRIQHTVKSGVTPERLLHKQQGQRQAFQAIMQETRIRGQQETFTRLMEQLEDQGQQLAEKRTVEHLQRYKKLVKQLLEEAIQYGLLREERDGFQQGRPKTYQIVKKVDEKLMDLTQHILEEERTSLEMLEAIGEIKGLIIHMYS